MNTERIQELFEAITEYTEEISSLLMGDISPEDETTDLLNMVNAGHIAKASVGASYADTHDKVVSLIDLKGQVVEIDGATVEVKAGSSRKTWDHKGLATDVARRIMNTSVNIDTGEVTKSPQEMMTEFLEYMGVSYWKVTKLKDLNLDADEYCEVSPPKKNIVIRRVK